MSQILPSGTHFEIRRPYLSASLAALRHVALGEGEDQKMPGKPFQIHFDKALRKDLQCRLADTRWSDAVTSDWRYGMRQSFLKTLVEYWQTTYSFDAAEHRMNAMTQFRATVGGFGVHYVHLRGQGPRPKPLLLMPAPWAKLRNPRPSQS